MPTALEILKQVQAKQAAQGQAPVPDPVVTAPPAPPPPTPKPPKPSKPVPVVPVVAPKITPPPVEDISSRALLVNIHLSCPGNSKVDQKFTEEVKQDKKLGEHSGRWNKCKFPPHIYAPLAAAFAAARSWHYANTLVYPETGWTMLPILNHNAYCAGFRQQKKVCEQARDTFLDQMDDIRAWAKREHNGNYDETLYDVEKLRREFRIESQFRPVPSGDHFAKEVRDLVGDDIARIDGAVQDAVAEAQRELWGRLLNPLSNMVTILGKREAGQKTRLDESLVENIQVIAALAPSLNVASDPRVDAFAAELAALVNGQSSENLSQDDQRRKDTLAEAKRILARMTGGK